MCGGREGSWRFAASEQFLPFPHPRPPKVSASARCWSRRVTLLPPPPDVLQVFEQEGWHHELNDAEEEMTYKVGEGGFRGHGRMIG